MSARKKKKKKKKRKPMWTQPHGEAAGSVLFPRESAISVIQPRMLPIAAVATHRESKNKNPHGTPNRNCLGVDPKSFGPSFPAALIV